MKIKEIQDLGLHGPKLITYERFFDNRGYFSEAITPKLEHQLGVYSGFSQLNETLNQPYSLRGLHFQYEPEMGKLIRSINGVIYDVMVDLRINSPFQKQGIIVKLDSSYQDGQWVWCPPGFAHGVFSFMTSKFEYFCSSLYNKDGESSIYPFDNEIKWDICNKENVEAYNILKNASPILSEKDRNSQKLNTWLNSDKSKKFLYGNC